MYAAGSKGLELYFASKRDGYYGLYRNNLKTTETLYSSREILQKFPNMAKFQMAYDISPDGRFLVFHTMSATGNMDIFLLNLETGELQNLTRDSRTNSLPVFSHSGGRIAYLSHERGGRHYENIFLVSRDGTTKKRLTADLFEIVSLEFSPDDREILFVKYLPYHSAVSLLDIETGTVKNLTSFAFANRSPSFNSDGSKIVYASDENGTFDIWIMDRDGSHKRVLYESPGFEYNPRFTHDDRRVIFVSDFIVDKPRGKTGTSVFSIDLASNELNDLLPGKFLRRDFFCFNPHLLDNDALLYFEGKEYKEKRETFYTVYLENLKTGRVKRLIKAQADNTEPNIVIE